MISSCNLTRYLHVSIHTPQLITVVLNCDTAFLHHFELCSTPLYSITNEGKYEECLSNSNTVTMMITVRCMCPKNLPLNRLVAFSLRYVPPDMQLYECRTVGDAHLQSIQ